MNLDGRRESSNVEDRRGMSGGKKAGLAGIGGIIIAMAIAYFTGGNPLEAGMQAFQENGGLGSLAGTNTEVNEGQREFTEEEQELARFSTQILAGTEDVWKEIFEENDMEYELPTMVLYTDGTQTACGQGSAAMGPFYCSGDQKLYIDLAFFTTMKRQLGADGDFAYAYVIAHEVGHHVEYLTGILQDAHETASRLLRRRVGAPRQQALRLAGRRRHRGGYQVRRGHRRRLSAEESTGLCRARVVQPRHVEAAHEVVQTRSGDRRRIARHYLPVLRC